MILKTLIYQLLFIIGITEADIRENLELIERGEPLTIPLKDLKKLKARYNSKEFNWYGRLTPKKYEQYLEHKKEQYLKLKNNPKRYKEHLRKKREYYHEVTKTKRTRRENERNENNKKRIWKTLEWTTLIL